MPDPPFKHHQENLGEAERVIEVRDLGICSFLYNLFIFL